MKDAPFRTLRERTLYSNRWLKLEHHDVERVADGGSFTYTYIAVNPAVMVVGVTAEGLIPIVRQYRYPSRSFNYELPGGGVGAEEPPAAARRELEEETGYRAGRVEKVGEFVTYCGLSDEICHVFVAMELEGGEQKLDPTEHITVREVNYQELKELIRAGEFRDGMGLASLNLAAERLEGLLNS